MDPLPQTHSTVQLIIASKFSSTNKVLLKCGNSQFPVVLPDYCLLPITESITLKDDRSNRLCLELLSKGAIQLKITQHFEIVKKCEQFFSVKVKVKGLTAAMMSLMMSGSADKTNEMIETLDLLSFDDVLKTFAQTYDCLGHKLHSKVSRKLKIYTDSTTRKASEKQTLEIIYEEYNKQSVDKTNSNQSSKTQNPNKILKVIEDETVVFGKITTGGNDENTGYHRRSGNRNRNSYQASNRQRTSNDSKQSTKRAQYSKQKIEQRILLGINGDSEAGWRSRMRSQINQGNRTSLEMQNKPIQQAHSQTGLKTESSMTGSPLVRVYSFPGDGRNFNFETVKQEFMLHVDDRFWIKYQNGYMTITQGEHGYLRKTNIDVDSNGFMAEGLTINLDGVSNLEDGGDVTGNPQLKNFIGDSQWWNIIKMDVYTFVRPQKQAKKVKK